MTTMVSNSGVVIQPFVRSRRPGWLRWSGLVVSWFFLLTLTAGLIVAVMVPKLLGATPYVIETGSMSPTMPPGSLAIVRPVDPVEVAVGDAITYQLRSGEPTVVTHRVISVGFAGAGDPLWRTQGDANPSPDKAWVIPAQLRGEVWYSVPYLGYVAYFLQGGARNIAVFLGAMGLIGYAVLMFQQSWADRRRGVS